MEKLLSRITCAALIVIMTTTTARVSADTPVTIPDSGLYDALFDELGEAPTEENMATLYSLYADSGSYTISDLTGLEYAVNLEELDLYGQTISDYSPISSLTFLQYLYLGDNFGLNDLSFLSGLDLFDLDISYCNVSDLSPLAGMYNLYYLDASGNNISDISALDGLISLEDVSLYDNNISDFSPLASASYYLFVDLYNNNISDISPAVNFSPNASIYLDDNPIEDFSALKDDMDLPYISLYDCPINAASFCHILPMVEANNYPGVIDLNTSYTCSDPAAIPDAALKSAIEAELGTVDPSINDMAGLQYLYVSSSGITDLTGLELATNLLELDVSGNSVMDITPLQYLRQLEFLDLSLNNLNQDSFCSILPMLTANNPLLMDGSTLFTDANPYSCPTSGHFIPDVNLRALVQDELGLSNEPNMTDMPFLYSLFATFTSGPESSKVTDLTGLEYATNLTYLDLTDHNVSDLSPLSGLTSLNGLYMSGNNISNLSPLAGLTNLQFLYVAYNSGITSISTISSLSSLQYFGCSGCSITSVAPVSGLTQLVELQIDYNPVTDITPIFGLPNLTRLGLAGLGLTDISFLSNWPNMTYLSLSSNTGADFSSLDQFTLLTSLYIYNASIGDISFLSTLVNLERLGLAQNAIEDISSIANLSALKSLFLYANQVSDISPLTGLTTLEFCYIYDNPLNTLAYCSHIPAIQTNNPGLINFNFGSNTNPLSSDCTTDVADLTIVADNWLRTDCHAGNNWCDGADFNIDGSVNFIDLVNLAYLWMAL